MENIYFKCHNGEFYTKHTKEEIYSMIDPYDWNTMLYWLKEMDYPPLSIEYFRKLEIAESRGQPAKSVFGKFLSYLRLCSFSNYSYEDGDFMLNFWDKETLKWGI